jgi:hypothetical protein
MKNASRRRRRKVADKPRSLACKSLTTTSGNRRSDTRLLSLNQIRLSSSTLVVSVHMLNVPRSPLRYILGIDAGPASVGWAVVELSEQGEPKRLHAAGVRRFEAGVEGDIQRGRDESLSTKRREARGPRRQA